VSAMTCDRAEELLSDDLEGALEGVLAADLAVHLAGCGQCRALRAAMADVTDFLRVPGLEPSAGLAERVARASWTATRLSPPRAARARAWGRAAAAGVGWLTEVPFAVQAVAAGFALVLTAGLVMAAGSAPGSATGGPRAAQRLSDATVYVVERKDRLVEDLRLLRVVIGTAFEGRLDCVNDRVDDYRWLLERRQKEESKRKGGPETSEPAATPSRRSV